MKEAVFKGDPEFEKRYVLLREREGWLCSQAELRLLPLVSAEHAHAREWKIRAKSAQRFEQYIRSQNPALNILEIGCGNGWLSNRIAGINTCRVLASDINKTELLQGMEAFSGNPFLNFMHGDIASLLNCGMKFDLIYFAASIQYFADLNVIKQVCDVLKPGGEIHVFDSPFYEQTELRSARLRSQAYYTDMGFPEMSAYYFHHSRQEMEQLGFKALYSPRSFLAWLRPGSNPFYWFRYVNRVLQEK